VQQVIALGNPDPQKNTGASANGPFTITNPADLKEALQSAAQERLGENLSDADIKKFSALYNGMESQASLRQQAAANANAQTSIVAPASPTAAADDYIQQHYANQMQSYGAISRQQAFFNLLGPAVGG
jgi:rRNA maturation endonuclease Nob1